MSLPVDRLTATDCNADRSCQFAGLQQTPMPDKGCFQQTLHLVFLKYLGLQTYLKAGTYYFWKVGSIALSKVQKHFRTISWSWNISKTIWGIIFQEFEIMDNLEIWYQHDICLIPLAMNISEGWDISHFKGDILRHILSSNPFLYNKREPKYKQNNMEHQISKH